MADSTLSQCKHITTMIHYKYIIPVLLCLLASCGKGKFHVNGEITNAKDSVLYFEHNGLDGFKVLDSVKLDTEGKFNFTGNQADNPEFYRLRIAGQIINLAIDSTETVEVKASYPLMATNYELGKSYENEKIRELALRQIELQTQCQAVANNPSISADSSLTVINSLIEQYKLDVSRNYIYKEPMKAYAYFALFQYIVINNNARLIFNPRENAGDIKVFGAVATNWDTFYPNSERGQNLHNIAIQGMKDQRIVKSNSQPLNIDASKVVNSGLIDIALMDNKGKIRRLSDLKGKVVMLDFHVFSTGSESTKRIMSMRDLYNKYHDRGFEIYQVSLDNNEHFWKTQTANLPWISVFDPDGIDSHNIVNYNVHTAPTFFLIDRNNVLQKRDVQIENLDAEIQAML